jgi:hypothetical protein
MTPDTLISELHAVRDEALAALDTAADSQQLRQLEIQFLGRKGALARVGK